MTENRGTGVLDARLSHALDSWSDTRLDALLPPPGHEPPVLYGSRARGRHMREADPVLRPVQAAPSREHREARHRRSADPAPVDLGTWFDLTAARHTRD